jgi:hypothetical protein
MKKLVLVVMLALSCLFGNAQDGLARCIDTDSTDIFISIYNSPVDTRVGIADLFYDAVVQQSELRAGDYTFIVNKAVVKGELFITKGSHYILYDFYIDEVRYPDGMSYRATRHQKPKGPWDYDKF